jgi:hypothetical protein
VRLLFNRAACQKAMHRYARMGALLQRFREESGDNISREDQQAVDEALAALPRYVGGIAIRVDTDGAAVAIDGERVGTTPLASPVSMDPGKHTVIVRKDGYDSVERPISVSAGESTTLVIELLFQQTRTPPAVPAAPSLETQPVPPSATAGTRWTPVVYGGAGVAAAGVVVGSIAGGLALSHMSTVQGACTGTICPTSVDSDLQSARTLGNVSTVAFVVAGVGATVGVVGFLWPRPDVTTAPSAAVSFKPWVAPGGAGIVGSF